MEDILDALAGISPGFLFEDPGPVNSPGYLVFVGVFALAFIGGLVAVLGSGRFAGGNRLNRRLLDRYGSWAAWLGGTGLLVVGLRYVHVVFFSKRLWTALNILALCAVLAHFLQYRVRRYAVDRAQYQEEERRRRFLPTPRRSPSPSRRPQRRRR